MTEPTIRIRVYRSEAEYRAERAEHESFGWRVQNAEPVGPDLRVTYVKPNRNIVGWALGVTVAFVIAYVALRILGG